MRLAYDATYHVFIYNVQTMAPIEGKVQRFILHDMYEYQGRGARILYGTVKGIEGRSWRRFLGVHLWRSPDHPAAVVILNEEAIGDVLQVSSMLNGMPIGIMDENRDGLPVLNMRALPGFWDGDRSNTAEGKAKALKAAGRMIDVYRYWKHHKALPIDVRRLMAQARSSPSEDGQRSSGLWTPP